MIKFTELLDITRSDFGVYFNMRNGLYGNLRIHRGSNDSGEGYGRDIVVFRCPLCDCATIRLDFHEDRVTDCDDNNIDPLVMSVCVTCLQYLQDPIYQAFKQGGRTIERYESIIRSSGMNANVD